MAGKKIGEARISVVADLDTRKAQKQLDKLTEPKEVEVKVNIKHVADQLQTVLSKGNKAVKDAFNVQELMTQMQSGINSMNKSNKIAWQATLDDFKKQFKDVQFQLDDGKYAKGYEAAIEMQSKMIEQSSKISKKSQDELNRLANETTESIKTQTDVINENVRAWEKLVFTTSKAGEKLLKLTKARDKAGNIIPQTYTAVDGKYQIEKGTVGWNVYETDNYSELLYGGSSLKEIQRHLDLATQKIKDEYLKRQKELDDSVRRFKHLNEKPYNQVSMTDEGNKQFELFLSRVATGELSAAKATKQLRAELDKLEITKSEIQQDVERRTSILGNIDIPQDINNIEDLTKTLRAYLTLHSQYFADNNYASRTIKDQQLMDKFNEDVGHRQDNLREKLLRLQDAAKRSGNIPQWLNNLVLSERGYDFDTVLQEISSIVGIKKVTEQIQDTTSAIVNQGDAMKQIEQPAVQVANAVKRSQEEIRKEIEDTNYLIKNQKAWLAELEPIINKDNFNTKGKKEATEQLRHWTAALISYRKDPKSREYESYAEEKINVGWNHAYQEAQRQGVAQSTLVRYDTDAKYDYDKSLKELRDHYDYRKETLEKEEKILLQLTQELESTQKVPTNMSKFTKVINNLTKKYGKESFSNIFGDIISGFGEISESNAIAIYDALIAKDKEYQAELAKQAEMRKEIGQEMTVFVDTHKDFLSSGTASQESTVLYAEFLEKVSKGMLSAADATGQFRAKLEALNQAQKENLVYHAGILGNLQNTLKSFRLGTVAPSQSGSVFNGLTGAYTTEDLKEFIGNEWQYAPISTIDLSHYKLFDARNETVATGIKNFFDDLNATIYGYYQSIDAESGELVKNPNVKGVRGLYSKLQKLFGDINLDLKTFTKFVEDAQAIVNGYNFKLLEYAALDEGVTKSAMEYALQGVSSDVFNSDSFQTQLMKMLGYEGIDLRGTKYNGTYTGGTVLFDIKPESLIGVDQKWSDVMKDTLLKEGMSITEDDLQREEKRRDLAFKTATEYKEIEKSILNTTNAEKDALSVSEKRLSTLLESAKQIPQAEGTIRLVHMTSDAAAKSMFENGFDYSKQGLLESTTNYMDAYQNWSDDGNLQTAAGFLEGRFGEIAAILDIPEKYINQYRNAQFSYDIDAVAKEFVRAAVNVDTGAKLLNEAYNVFHEVEFKKIQASAGPKRPSAQSQKKISEDITNEVFDSSPVEKQTVAIEENTQSQEKNNEVKKEASNLSRDTIKTLLSGVDAYKILKDYGIPSDKIDEGMDKFKDFAVAIHDIESGISTDISSVFTDLFNFISSNASSITDVEKVYTDFYKKMHGVQILIPKEVEDSYAQDFPDKWKALKKLTAIGSKQRLLTTTSKHASTPDQLYNELIAEGFGWAIKPENDNGAKQNILDAIINAIQKARAEYRAPKTITRTGLDEYSQNKLVQLFINEIEPKISENAKRLISPVQETIVDQNKLANEVNKVANAFDNQANSAKNAANEVNKLGDASNNATSNNSISQKSSSGPKEKTPNIFDLDEDNALKQLRNAINNKTKLIDLSGVYSTDDLESELQSMVQSILGNQTDLTFGSVVTQGDVARIQLYNKELGVTIGQVYQLKKASEDDDFDEEDKYELVHLPEMDMYRHDAKAAKTWSEAQQRKLAQNDAWMLNRLSELKTQERKYKQSNKKISGDTVLENVDDTTLLQESNITIDKLAESIRERIKNSFGNIVDDSVKNGIKQDLNALSDEIKIAQYKQYATTTMKPTELAEARKNLENMLNTAESKARKNNVFTQMQDDFNELRASLTDEKSKDYIKDATGLGEFVDKFRTTKSKLGYEISQSQEMKKLLTLQEQLYDAKKRYAKLEAQEKSKTSEGLKASRKVEELQEQYDISLKLLASEESRNKLKERETKLQKELNTFAGEQSAINTEEDTDNQQPNNIKKYYDDYLKLMKQLNTVNQQLYDYQSKNETGAYGGLIEQLQEQKNRILEEINDINQSVNNEILKIYDPSSTDGDKYKFDLSKYFDQNQASIIKEFFNNAKVEAELGADAIQKFIDVVLQSQKIDTSFVDNVGKQFASLSELHDKIKDIGVDDTTKVNAESLYNAIQEGLAIKLISGTDWTGEQEKALQRLIEKYTEYGTALDNVNQKQKKYFEGKVEYSGGKYDDPGALVPVDDINKIDDSKSKLVEIAKEFSNGKAIITGFTKSADGISKLDFSIFDEGTNKLKKFKVEMGSLVGAFNPEEILPDTASDFDKAYIQFDKIVEVIGKLKSLGVDESSYEPFKKLIELRDKLNSGLSADGTMTDFDFSNLAQEVKVTVAEVDKLLKKFIQMQQLFDNGDAIKIGKINKDGDIYTQISESVRKYAASFEDSTVEIGKFNNANKTLKFTITDADGTIHEFIASMDQLTGAVAAQETGTRELGSKWDQFTNGLKKSLGGLTSYSRNVFDIYALVNQVRKGIDVVREIDSAMTELKKVTNETDSTYSNFLSTAQEKASAVGSTMKEFIETTSDFARLGYSIEEATSLSETANIYKNVGDGMKDVGEASESIISTMKAFGIEAGDTMSIVDKFNEVSNNFAISSSGIGEALQRSAAALAESGNTLDESIALITAANNVVQNPETVGTAFKTLALRLRGAKVELEEAGEDTENMATSTAQLQEKLLALTGGKVDIMLDENTFKSTIQILREMSTVWEEMTDIEQASALELMGGKRQANVLATVINNFDIVEDAMNKAQNSMGSAAEENAKYMDSLQGRIDLFNNALQAMWSNALESDMLKGFVDLGTELVKIIDSLGLIPSLLATIVGFNLVKHLGSLGVALLQVTLAEHGLTTAQIGQAGAATIAKAANTGLIASFKTLGKVITAVFTNPWGIAIAVAAAAIGTIIASVSSANKAIREAREEALNSVAEVQEKQTSLEEYKEQARSLREELDSGNLSEKEAYDARAQLISIQDELISKFGLEAQGINLVTGAINDQIAAIDELSQQSAQDWLAQEIGAYNEAIKVMQEKHDSENELLLFNNTGYNEIDENGIETTKLQGTFSDIFKKDESKYNKIVKDYVDGLNDVITKYGGEIEETQYSDQNYFSHGFSASFNGKTIEELAEIFDEIQAYYYKFANNYGVNLDSEIARLQNVRNQYLDEDYLQSKELYEKGRQQDAIANYASQYNDILDAQGEIYESSNDQDRLDAIEEFNNQVDNAIREAESREEDHMVDYFKGLKEDFSAEQFELQVKLNEDGLKTELQNIIKEGGESGLSVLDNNQITDMVNRGLNKEGAVDNSGIYTSEQIAGLQSLQIQADEAGISLENLITILVNLGLIAGQPVDAAMVTSIKKVGLAYSTLSASAEKYTNINEVLNEATYDNVKLSEEQYNALQELIGSEEEFAECIDTTNGNVVTNTKLLNKLVKEKKKELATDVKLAKSQARLEYYDLVKQLRASMNGISNLNAETRESIYSTLDQIDAVQQSIYKYQLLEDSLLGVTNAFEEFANAQEIDQQNTYGDSYVEMAQTMYDAFYKTGKVGTEANWAAIEALVPDSVYQGLEDDGKKLQAIYEYFNNNILPSLTLDNDSLSLEYNDVEDFVTRGISSGVFEGNVKDFNLVEGMNLEKAAELMGMTKTQAYALFAALDDYNGSRENSFLTQLDDSLEGEITGITSEIEELNRKKLALLEDGGYEGHKDEIDKINTQLGELDSQLGVCGQNAYQMWEDYTKNDAALQGLSEIEDKQRQLTEAEVVQLGLEWNEETGMTVQQAYDQLLAKQLLLEEPTVLTAQLAIENIDTQIANLESQIQQIEASGISPRMKEAEISSLEAQIQQLEEDKVVLSTTFGIELSEEDQAELQSELDTIEKIVINDKEFSVIAKGTSETIRQVNSVKSAIDSLHSKTVTVTARVNNTGGNSTYHPPGSGGRYTMADGTAHVLGTAYDNGSWGAPKTETALVGELGPEMLVRNGRWMTIGDNGAEFTQIKKGDIIFNHKQTEDLLSKGYVTSRGKAYASGTAYATMWNPTKPDSGSNGGSKYKEADEAADKLSGAADKVSDSADEFKEVFDWIEVRLEEINDDLDLKNAKLENAVGASAQNKIIDDMIALNKDLYNNLTAGANKYYSYAKTLLSKIPAEYREMAQNGAIAIEEFVGEVDEKTLTAIQEYRDWVQKGDDVTQQAEETLTEISTLAKQAIDNIAQMSDNKVSLRDNKIDQYEAYNGLLETDVGFESESIYRAMMAENNKIIAERQKQRDEMQSELNKKVKSGQIKVGSQDWYDAINDIAAVDAEIIELKNNTEDWQDEINNLHWDKFDLLMDKLSAVSDEAENLIDVLSHEDLFEENGDWTNAGVTSLGLYAQQMEAAEIQAKKYKEEIAYLNKNWKKLGYTEAEYIDKLKELKDGQYGAIQAYHDAKDAIIDLNKERVDAIKEGIEKEIEAYEELINKKKEALDADKDQADFEKSVKEKNKNISEIKRELAALAGNDSLSAQARRSQLQAELAEAQAELQEVYDDRAYDLEQEVLDKKLENFKEEKDAEMESWDEYLENTEQVVADSLTTIQANTSAVYETLKQMSSEYGLSITDSLVSPWKEGESAIQSFSEKFGISMSATVEELIELETQFLETMNGIEQAGVSAVNTVKNNASTYSEAKYENPKTEKPKDNKPKDDGKKTQDSSSSGSIKVGGKINAGSAKIYGYPGATSGSKQYFASDPIYTVLSEKNGYVQVRWHKAKSGSSGWFKKSDVKAYAKGTVGVNKNQMALIDELGEELVMHAGGDGKLAFLSKGSSVIPHDISENIMKLGMLDPQEILDRNRPTVSAPHIVNNNIELNMQIAEVVHIDEVSNDTIPNLTKAIEKQMDKYMKGINNNIRKYVR